MQRKRPTALGQADYYGAVANTAARVMAITKPGAICVEGHLPFGLTRHKQVYDVPHLLEVDLCDEEDDALSVGLIKLVPKGKFPMKGVPRPAPIFEVR